MPESEEPFCFDGPVVALLGSTEAGKTSLLNFLIQDLGKFRTGHGNTTREPIRIRGTGDGWNLPLTEDEVRKRLTDSLDKEVNRTKGEGPSGSKFDTGCLRDGTWIVDLPGFDNDKRSMLKDSEDNEGEDSKDDKELRCAKEYMKKADLILFVAGAEGEYKRGCMPEVLRERMVDPHPPPFLVFLTKPDTLTKDKIKKVKPELEHWLSEKKLELPEKNRFLFANRMRDPARLETLSRRGILKQMTAGLERLKEVLEELPDLHLERKLREIQGLGLRGKLEDYRIHCLLDFLEREIKLRGNKRKILLETIQPLAVIEDSESDWNDETDEMIKKALGGQPFEMNETAHRLSALRHSVRDASRTWKFWTKKFWRRNEWFAKELESRFERELEKLLASFKSGLFHYVCIISQLIADSLKKHAAALGTEAKEGWRRTIISQRDGFRGRLDQSLPSLRLCEKQEETDRKASFPDSICRNFRSGLVQDCLCRVSLLKVDEEEQFDEIMVCFQKLTDAFKEEMEGGIYKEAFTKTRHLGHEMRIEATRCLEKPRHSLEKVCRDLKRYEDEREKISSH